VHQANQVGPPITIGLSVSVLVSIQQNKEDDKWRPPISVERISTDMTPCKIAKNQLNLLEELTHNDQKLNVIVADCAYGGLEPCSNQIDKYSVYVRLNRSMITCFHKLENQIRLG
jgi:hypothetical protein